MDEPRGADEIRHGAAVMAGRQMEVNGTLVGTGQQAAEVLTNEAVVAATPIPNESVTAPHMTHVECMWP